MRAAVLLTIVAALLIAVGALRPPTSRAAATIPCDFAVLVDGVLLCDDAAPRDLAALCGTAAPRLPLRSGDALMRAERCAAPGGVDRMAGDDLDALAVPIDLNDASAAELESLPGIGPSLARAIVEGRPYESVDALLRVPGIGPARLAAVRPRARVRASQAPAMPR